ncbi:hypothetical protein B1218_37040, partial [Pseudomonas ogarae]
MRTLNPPVLGGGMRASSENGERIGRASGKSEAEGSAAMAVEYDVAARRGACGLGYLEVRQPELEWRKASPQLAAWFAEVS